MITPSRVDVNLIQRILINISIVHINTLTLVLAVNCYFHIVESLEKNEIFNRNVL